MKRIFITGIVILLILGCSTQDVVRIARITATGDTASAQRMVVGRAVRYAANPKALERDIKRFKKDFEFLIQKFRNKVVSVWGKKEKKEPKPKKYVKYTQNYLSRALVDFNLGIITVETLDQKNPVTSLKNAIVTTLLTPDDPRAVDLFSSKAVKLGEKPFLYTEVKDHEGKDIRWHWRAERFAEVLVKNNLMQRKIKTGDHGKIVNYVKIAMVKDHLQIRAIKFKPFVQRFAKRFDISNNLVYAIIKTESDFNPYAVSNAPAFGLMQIVPSTAGRDVHRLLNKNGIPSGNFLLNPENNIKYGTAFLHILNYNYLKQIKNPVSREYCVIAAYNGGAGNVLTTFDTDRKKAPDRINGLTPFQVFNHLKKRLPRYETRRYLTKVITAQKEFVNF